MTGVKKFKGILLGSTVLMVGVCILSCEQLPPAIDTPIVKFSGEPREGNEPLVVKFTDLSEVKDSQIVAWYWDFGDGETSSLPNPMKTYYHNPKDGNNPSFYTVRLRITTSKGTSERTEVSYIRVNPGTTITVLDPNQDSYTGLVEGYGVVLKVPKGALKQKTTFNINQLDRAPSVRFSEDIEVVSNYYRIAHNSPGEDLFAREGDRIIPTEMQIPLLTGEGDRTDRPSNRYIIMALFEDGSVIPVLGERKDKYAVSNVTGLPAEAIYFVGFFPKALISNVTIDSPEDLQLKYPWALKWKVFGSENALKQIVALEKGDMNSPNSFYREDFSEDEVTELSGKVVENLLKSYIEFLASGLKNPILVDVGDGGYGLLLFNINPVYTSDYDDFNLLRYGSSRFGNVVIDPKQLLMISIHNAISARNNPDIKQKFTIYNAFAQYLFYSCYKNYRLLDLSVPDLSDIDPTGSPRMVSYMNGLRESLAIYFGQRSDKVAINGGTNGEIKARSFGENEYYDLTQTLFQPVAQGKKRYYSAGHEFWVFLDKYLEENYADVVTPVVIGAFLKGLEEVFVSFNPRQVITYELLVRIVYETLDEVLRTATSESEKSMDKQQDDSEEEGLSDIYWKFARGRGFERDDYSSLRPSDEDIEDLEPNEKAFSVVPISAKEIPAPTDNITISANNLPEINNVLPCSSRVVRIKINPMSSKLRIIFYPSEWVKDEDGNSLKFALYHPSKDKFYLLDDDGLDADSDGVNDEIVLTDFSDIEEGCFDYIYLLVSNVSLSSVSPIKTTFKANAGKPFPENEILKEYVEKCDPYYDYELVSTGAFTQVGVSSYVLKMTSGMWRGESEVKNAVPWEHFVTIIEPSIVLSDKALLVITGGSSTTEPDLLKLANLAIPFVSATGTLACFIKAVPNQPLRFVGDTKDRVEDGIIAYSFDKYMKGFEVDSPDMTWPVLLPMVRSAVRAMDTIQDFVKYKKPGRRLEINNFIVTGASKRGWTSWLTSAVDSRVCAVIPIVIDVLNMPLQIEHHYNSYGTFSTALKDYVEFGIFDRIETPEGNSLWKIVDPIHYVNFLQIPKFIVNSTGDQFFLPDSAKFYFSLLKPSQSLPNGVIYPVNAYLYYAPNTDHSVSSSDAIDLDEATLKSMLAFYISEVNSREKPKFVWWVEEDVTERDPSKRAIRIRLDAITKPKEVLLWQATNNTKRDFRLQTIGLSWTSRRLKPFCAECGGDPGFDYDSIFEGTTSVTSAKSHLPINENHSGYKAMLGDITGTDRLKWVCLEGDYYQMGYEYGSLLKEEIVSTISAISSVVKKRGGTYESGMNDIPEIWGDIIRGISDATELSFEEVVNAHYVWASYFSKQSCVDSNYIYGCARSDYSQISNYIVVIWKPIGIEEFITIEPMGLVSMNLVLKGNEVLTLCTNTERISDKIQSVFRWINSEIQAQRVDELDQYDFVMWDGYKYNAVKLQSEKLLLGDLRVDDCIASEGHYIYQFDPVTMRLAVSNTEVNLRDLSSAIESNHFAPNNEGEKFSIAKVISTSPPHISEKTANYQVEGEDGEECVCEFGPNEVYPYVATVPVPDKGWTAFFVQIKFPGPERYVPELKDIDYVFSTRVVVVPDVYPSEIK
ncbi:MAG: PhoPQ-activated protein PqaA family protein [Candidatus Hydrogenedentes bacterium]|nr:PhoPQ-activated protein PqaA family protein [Candidatus Hydrogenedentota bacterium]